ncbi:MAG TPA: DNA repair protein RadA [Patescibacteria group bacterium]|nr:DNA repair protein RadA [Patescibacteria group bacterium]
MARTQSRFVCQACGADFLRWEGQCRSCAAWNTLVETVVSARPRDRRPALVGGGAVAPVPLSAPGEPAVSRLPTGLRELDRVLGGGIVPGSLVLIGGEPGVGKSTLLLQVAGGVAAGSGGVAGGGVLYATGEESASQLRLRAERLGLGAGPAAEAVAVLATSEVGAIVEAARAARPAIVVVDSIQTMTVDELDGAAGSVGQVRESALRLMELAKGDGIAVVLVGHVTKDGSIAGPRTLEHLVDAVIELGGERGGVMRLLRATKNRFGSTDELGVFEMGEDGLREVADPGRAFLAEHEGAAPGSVVAATLEGTRPLLVEVQALVAPAGYGTPARRASGVDPTRLALLLAVLGRRAGIGLSNHDVYANLAGGLSIAEPGLDLAVALALASSLRDRPVDSRTVAVGEVGLLGELRPVSGLDRRLREAARLGFERAIVPAGGRASSGVEGIRAVPAATLRDAVRAALLPGDRHPDEAGERGEALAPVMIEPETRVLG